MLDGKNLSLGQPRELHPVGSGIGSIVSQSLYGNRNEGKDISSADILGNVTEHQQ